MPTRVLPLSFFLCLTAVGGAWGLTEHVRLRGLVETTVRGETSDFELNENNRGDNPYDFVRLRLFVEAAPTRKLQIHSQIIYNDNYYNGFALAGAYVLFDTFANGELFIEAGKIPSPFGTYAARSYSDKTPLIGTPLMYYYHSTLLDGAVPTTPEDLLDVWGSGQGGLKGYPSNLDPGARSQLGLPIIYDPCWDIGAVVLGSRGAFEYRLGLTAGTPASPVRGRESNDNKSVVARVGWVPAPWLAVGTSAAQGAYLNSDAMDFAGENMRAENYMQTAFGYDLEVSRGHVSLRSEGVRNTFESPYLSEHLRQHSYYVETEATVYPGLGVAVRWDEMIYDHITTSTGDRRRWDRSIRRLEAGATYWVSEMFLVKVNQQWNSYGPGGFHPREGLTALQLVGRF